MKRFSAEIVESFVRTLLRPVVRFCVRRSFSYSEFSKLAKQIFYESAEEYIRGNGETTSVSKISALTGLDRRDLTRFYKEGNFFVRKENLLGRVMGQWEQDARFSRGAGKPKALTCEGVNSEFFALVQSVSKDLNPYTVLSELERVAALEKEDGKVKLTSQIYVPRSDLDDGLRILGSDSQDLLEAVSENLVGEEASPNLHIRTQYDNLSPQALPKIKEWFLERGEKIHQEVRRFLAKSDKDVNPDISQGGGRAVFTSFALVEKPKDENS